MDLNPRDPLTAPGLILAIQLLALAAYGYYAGRRIPFMMSLVIILCGLVWMIIRINVWLIPFVAGLTLLAAAILAEELAETLEQWILGGKYVGNSGSNPEQSSLIQLCRYPKTSSVLRKSLKKYRSRYLSE